MGGVCETLFPPDQNREKLGLYSWPEWLVIQYRGGVMDSEKFLYKGLLLILLNQDIYCNTSFYFQNFRGLGSGGSYL